MTRALPWLLLASLTLIKLFVAAKLALFGDEVFYWQESRQLALAYSDLPGMTAWMVAVGVKLIGDNTLGVRLCFLMLGALITVVLARSLDDAAPSSRARMILVYLCLPPFALMGLVAVPDVPMLFALAILTLALPRALKAPQLWVWWVIAGLALAMGLASHYRFGISAAGALAYFVFDRRGRTMWRQPGFYLMGGIAALGLGPMLWFNLAHDLAAVRFQLVDRHPWQLQAEGFLLVAKQFLLLTPLLCWALLAVGNKTLRSANDGQRVLGYLAVIPAAILLGLGLFADQRNINFHWLLAAWLPLLPGLATRLARWTPRWRHIAMGTGAVATGALLLAIAYVPWIPTNSISRAATQAENFVGWQPLADVVRQRKGDRELLADNFIVAGQISFHLPGHPTVRVLEHRINHSYGRTVQLKLWERLFDAEAQLSEAGGLLVVELTSHKLLDRPGLYASLCQRFGEVRWVDQLNILGGKKRFALFEVSQSGAECSSPPVVYLDHPRPDTAYRRDELIINGWAVVPNESLIMVAIDGEGVYPARTGFSADGAPAEKAGFRLRVPEALAAGHHRLRVEVQLANGMRYVHRWIPFELRDG